MFSNQDILFCLISHLGEGFATIDFGDKFRDLGDVPLGDLDGLCGARVGVDAAGRLADGGPRRLRLLGGHVVAATATKKIDNNL